MIGIGLGCPRTLPLPNILQVNALFRPTRDALLSPHPLILASFWCMSHPFGCPSLSRILGKLVGVLESERCRCERRQNLALEVCRRVEHQVAKACWVFFSFFFLVFFPVQSINSDNPQRILATTCRDHSISTVVAWVLREVGRTIIQ